MVALVMAGSAVVPAGPFGSGQAAAAPAAHDLASVENLYAGDLDPDRTTVSLDGGGILAVSLQDETRSGARVLVGLRPSAITIHTARPEHASPRNVWPGAVAGLELLADRVRVQVDGVPPALVDITPAAVAELGLHTGQQVWLSAKATETDAYPDAAAD